jgi:hypothetical protein
MKRKGTGQGANEAEMKKRSAAGSRREFLKQAVARNLRLVLNAPRGPKAT